MHYFYYTGKQKAKKIEVHVWREISGRRERIIS